ncbi:MAG: hypothetical protein IKV41_07375 [Oscillospiraceae bacterium]|nr:hypothetical protein [Oscillospiraceae bacterium]
MIGMSEFFKSMLKEENRLKMIFLLGISGIILIFISGLGTDKNADVVKTAECAVNSSEYIREMELKLKDVLQGIDGVGNAQVMLTVDQSAEYIFASEDKTNSDRYQDFDGEHTKKVQTRTTTENNYILVDDVNGNTKPLIKTQIEPVIKGVVVVCQGAESPVVCVRITDALTTVLGIGADKVCIVPAKSER